MPYRYYGSDAFDFVARLKRLSSDQEIRDALRREIARFGFNRLILTGTDPRQPFKEQVLWYWGPRELLETFSQRGYIKVDPIYRQCRRSAMPFDWDGEDYKEGPAREIMALRAEFGTKRGLITPIHGPGGYEAAISFAGEKLELPPDSMPGLFIISYSAFYRVRELIKLPAHKPLLTEREREVLLWHIQGKNPSEVADTLNLSERTVGAHIKSVILKLGAKNHVQLGAIAVREGIVP
jgi:LuxR family transcriptional regulator, quorum-sensing system regulator BjaR1